MYSSTDPAFAQFLFEDIEAKIAILQGNNWLTSTQVDSIRAQLRESRKRIDGGVNQVAVPTALTAARPAGSAGSALANRPQATAPTAAPGLPSRPQANPSPLVVVAMYNFEGTQAGDLKFFKGDRITVTDSTSDANWWVGTLNGRSGSFPKTFVEVVSGAPAQPPVVYVQPVQTVVVQQPAQQVVQQRGGNDFGRQMGTIAASSAAAGFGATAGSIAARTLF